MRFARAIKNFITLTLAVAFALATCFIVKAAHISRLSSIPGERAYYLDSASSQSLIKTELSFADIFRVRGESVCFACTEEKEAFARALIEEYGGTLLFTEEACGVQSYYAYVPAWGQGVALYGKQVNLHIAVSLEDNRCAVGIPIIFGGF